MPRGLPLIGTLVCALVGLPLSATRPASADAARDRLRLADGRTLLYRTLLELQIRYLGQTVEPARRPAAVAYYLGRTLLLAGQREAALKVLSGASQPATRLEARLIALWRKAAAGEPLSAAPPPPGDPVAGVAAFERAFLLAWHEDRLSEAELVARGAASAAASRGLDSARSHRALAYLALRSGALEVARRELERIPLRAPEARAELGRVDIGDGDGLQTEVQLYAPETYLCRAQLAYLETIELATGDADRTVRMEALIAAGRESGAEALAATDDPALAVWAAGLRLRGRRQLGPDALVSADATVAQQLAAARVARRVLGRPDMALGLLRGALSALRTRDTRPLGELVPAHAALVGELAGALLAAEAVDSSRPVWTRGRAAAFELLDRLFRKGRRSNLWELDLLFLARLAQLYVQVGRYDDLIGYLFRRRTIPELAAIGAPFRAMARELQAFASFDRQQQVHTRAGAPSVELVTALFGSAPPVPPPPTTHGPPAAGSGPAPTVAPAPAAPAPAEPPPAWVFGAVQIGLVLGGLLVAVLAHRVSVLLRHRF